MNNYISPMYSQHLNEGAAREAGGRSAPRSVKGIWRVLPIEGAFELSYCDEAGNPTLRRVIARELKIGPGKTILGAIDMAHDGYRGFRADRIARVVDAETGETIERNVLDWLTGRAERQAKAERKAFLKAVKEADKPGRRRETNPL
jgi:predicted DNA-binding transcriptional regulator YafY